LALGNRLFGARADLLRQPLATYGYLEIAIGLYAFFFEYLYMAADAVFVAAGAPIVERSHLLLLLKGALAVGLLLGPTVLMGGTLPLLAAWLQKQVGDPGRLSARFYSINSLGAVAGAGIGAFVLVRSLGMVSSMQLTALANVLIGVAAIALARRDVGLNSPKIAAPAVTSPGAAPRIKPFRWAVLLVIVTGATSMGLEVLAARSLALIFGASLQAFAIVLMAFILGIGLGSAAVSSPRMRRWHSPGTVVVLLLCAAGFIGLLVIGIEQWVEIYRHLRAGFARSSMGYRYHQAFIALFSLVILGIPAALLGAVLPLCIRVAAGERADLGRAVGRLLTWNTLGAVGGVLITGFVLMPMAGLRNSFAILALLLCTAALCLCFAERRRALGGAVAAGMAFLGVVLVTGGEGWKHVLNSGIFRSRELEVTGDFFKQRKDRFQILFYEDAADATVTVELDTKSTKPDDMGMRINGKPDASVYGDRSTQLLLGHLPMMMRPDSTDVFVLGLGSGMTAGALLAHPVERIIVAENCAPVVRAAELFAPWNRGALTNSRVKIWHEDARTLLKLFPRRYDLIISEPSNPWTVGVGSVFSREFYQLSASRLKPGGLMAQWFHVYEMHDQIVNLVLRTFHSVFPHMEIWETSAGDLVLLGGLEPWESRPEIYAAAFEREEVLDDLKSLGFHRPEALWARQFASQETAFAIAGHGGIQLDAFPVLEYAAPKAFYIGARAQILMTFDERMIQHQLAPESKRQALASLTSEELKQAFSYSSVNDSLTAYLAWHVSNVSETGVADGSRSPRRSIFKPASFHRAPAQPPEQASEHLRRLMDAEALFESEPDKWRDAVQMIQTELVAQKSNGRSMDISKAQRSYYAALAARTSMHHRLWESARELLLLALEDDPEEPQLNYLARILQRLPEPGHERRAAR
jgi:spermidine synthase